MTNLHNMTWAEINAIVFEGASVYEPRSLSDRLSDNEILSLTDHPAYDLWPNHVKDWIWNAVDSIIQ